MAHITEDLPQHNLSVSELKMLHEQSMEAKAKAYCPYSNFQVGCALLLHDDLSIAPSVVTRTIQGANVENAAYPSGVCAERVALGAAIGHYGLTGSQIKAIAVTANLESPCSPCGACRQFMREFLGLDVPVVMFGLDKEWVVKTMGELLPMSFGPDQLLMNLGVAADKGKESETKS